MRRQRGSWLVAVYPVLGWLTVCTALYSVTVSVCPEPATLRAPDDWELVAAYRPLYLVLLTLPLITIKLQSVTTCVSGYFHVSYMQSEVLRGTFCAAPKDSMK